MTVITRTHHQLDILRFILFESFVIGDLIFYIIFLFFFNDDFYFYTFFANVSKPSPSLPATTSPLVRGNGRRTSSLPASQKLLIFE